MKEDLEVDVQGLDDVLTAFNYLNDVLDKGEIRTSLKNASKMLMEQGKSNLKSRMKSGSTGVTGNLLRAFRYKLKSKNRGALIGFDYSRQGKGSHAHLVDRGTEERHSKYGNRGHITGNKFWSDVNENDTDRAMNMVAKAIQSAISKI